MRQHQEMKMKLNLTQDKNLRCIVILTSKIMIASWEIPLSIQKKKNK